MDEFYKCINDIREEIEGKIVAIPGYNPIGRVVKVDEFGAWLEGEKEGRISLLGLIFYHSVKENRTIPSD